MKIKLAVPVIALALAAGLSSCEKTEIREPAPPATSAPLAAPGGPGLMYFGTPYEMLGGIYCTTPCGVCHVVHRAPDYFPDMSNPDNNEAVTDVHLNAQGHLVLSVHLEGVSQFYTGEIEASHHLPVAQPTTIPQSLSDLACDAAGAPRFQSVMIPAGNYPVQVDPAPQYTKLDMEGALAPDGSWIWTFHMY